MRANDDTGPVDGERVTVVAEFQNQILMEPQPDDRWPLLTLEQLMGKYFRLRDELTRAWVAVNQHTPRQGVHYLDRLTDDIAQVEREIRRLAPVDEQTDELHTGYRF